MIERHVTLERADGGPDGAFSLEPSELEQLVRETQAAHDAVGETEWLVVESEETSRGLKRSLYVTSDCEAGDILTEGNVRSIRPNGGLAPKYYDQVLGRRLRSSAKRGTPLTFQMLENESP